MGSRLRAVMWLLVMVAGLVVMLYAMGTLAGNALPYPDPTPALLAAQSAKTSRYAAMFGGGLVLAVGGGIAWWFSRRAAKRSSVE